MEKDAGADRAAEKDAKEDRGAAQGDVIAAVSTPHGTGGIAVIRASGAGVIGIARKVFVPKSENRRGAPEDRRAVYGTVYYDGEEVDDALMTVFYAPRSYTGEDEVEISCHGGILVTARVLESLLSAGARRAEPGEFSRRAFLNGKLSLTQAEATIDLINAENEQQLRLAGSNARGALQRRIDALCAGLTALLADLYVTIDYPEEDLSSIGREELTARLKDARRQVGALLESYQAGAAIAHGVPTVIVGRPNTGKSSLLNLLLGRERAIVTEYAGTTRDTVEETLTLGKITLRLCDTAGLRETDDPVEKIGVQRSYEKLRDAGLVYAVFDGGEEARGEDLALIRTLKEIGKPTVALVNKSDRERLFDLSLLDGFPVVVFSALEKEVPGELVELTGNFFMSGALTDPGEGLLTNARQAAGARRALEALDRAIAALEMREIPDVASLDVEEALEALAGIDGRAVGEEITAQIFSRFCVGK